MAACSRHRGKWDGRRVTASINHSSPMLFPRDFSRIKLSTSISIYHLIATHINPNDWSTASPDTRDLEARGCTNVRRGRQRVILRLTRRRGRLDRETRSCLKVSAFWWWLGFHVCCHNDFICILLRAGVKEEGTLAAGSCPPVIHTLSELKTLRWAGAIQCWSCISSSVRNAVLQNHSDSERFAFCTAQVSEISPLRSVFSACSALRLVDPRWM